ncbi:hypothetical protein L208DRAFT_1374411 [Tricholoma matsutake]|nr:hypothetical protein L208DRAFT_1374411 [Tricholoma matsutake 945]
MVLLELDAGTSDKDDELNLGINPIVKLISGFPQNSSAPLIHTPLSEMRFEGSTNVLWVNGASIQDKDINPWGLMRVLRRERGLIRALMSAGQALAVEGGRSESEEEKEKVVMERVQSQSDVLEGLFDMSDRVEGGSVIVWWNDLEKDLRYKRWSPSLYALLHQYYPSQLLSIKLNLFNIVLVLDLSHIESLHFIIGPMANIVGRGYPLRMGVVPLLSANKNGDGSYLRCFVDVDQDADPKIDWSIVQSAFGALEYGIPDQDDEDHGAGPTFNFQPKPQTTLETQTKVDLEDILAGKPTYMALLEKTRSYVERLDAGDGKEGGHAFVNGKHFNVDDDFMRQMQMEIGKQMEFLQEQIYDSKIKGDKPTSKLMATYFYDQPSSSQQRNWYIYPMQAVTGGRAKWWT